MTSIFFKGVETTNQLGMNMNILTFSQQRDVFSAQLSVEGANLSPLCCVKAAKPVDVEAVFG